MKSVARLVVVMGLVLGTGLGCSRESYSDALARYEHEKKELDSLKAEASRLFDKSWGVKDQEEKTRLFGEYLDAEKKVQRQEECVDRAKKALDALKR